MNVKNSWKRVVAGMLAVLVMAATVPAGTDFGGYFGGTDIVASADTAEQSETIATNQRKSTYNGTNVTITVQHPGTSNGMVLSSGKSATISVADGYIISKVEFTRGSSDINYLRSEAGNVTYSGDVATVSDVNAQSLTVNGADALSIKQVKVYYEPVSAEKSETFATNKKINTYNGTNVTISTQDAGTPEYGMYLASAYSATISVADKYQITKVEFTNGYPKTPITRLSSAAGNVTYSGDVATVSDVNAQSLTVNGTGAVFIKQVKVYYTEKTEWAIGENINLNGKWFFVNDLDTVRVRGSNSSAAVPTPVYDEVNSQWKFGPFISIDQYSEQGSGYIEAVGESSLYIKKPSGKSSADKPSGFKIKSGSGTQADPYTFELVYPSKVDVTGVDLNKTTANIPYGGTETLTATVAPDGATDKTVTWSSSDTTVATVDENGVVTAVALGTATITATASNGTDDTADDKTATCAVTVEKADPTVKTAPAAVADLTYNGEPQDLITAGTSEDGTVQYAVVETDDDDDDYAIAMRDTDELLDLDDVVVDTIYTPDLEGKYQGQVGVRFNIDTDVIIDDITHNGITLYYNTGNSKYYLNTDKGPLNLPEGCNGLLITDIDSGNVYVELVNTANPAGEVEIDEEAWVESIPNETDAGEYNVYYRVKGDANHNDSKPTKIDGVKIAKADATVTAPEPIELTYTGEAQELVTEGTATGGTMMYAVNKDSSTEPTLFTDDIPSETNAGTYYVWYTLDGEDNYNDTDPKYVPVTINKADPTLTTEPKANTMTYTGEAQELVTAGKAENGTVKYAIGTDAATAPTGEYSADVPTKTDAGTYYVWYKVVGDENHNDTEAKPIAVTIDKADQSPSAKTLTYTAQPQELVNPGKALTGKMLYAVNTDPSAAPTEGYSETVPTETNAGQYYVWFKLTGNGNYKDSTPICIPVEIKKINATVTADNITKNCGREDPELTYKATGLLKGDTFTGALAREAGETAGKYKITQGTLTNGNYNITFTGAEFTIEATQVNRLAGANRYETAIAISSDNFEKADTVILTNAQNYADGIAGVPLASKLNAPILLTAADKLNDKTLEEIKRLGAKNVIILGGESAVSADVAKALEDENYVVERLEGKSRFSTAAAIAQKVNENPTDIFFVYGMGFADTLSVSSVAALKNAPIVYLTTDGELNADTAAYLAQLKEKGCVKNAYVIGGTSVISDDMMNKAAQALGLESATRIAGANRYETSAEVNKAFADLFENDEMCVATGVDFPDAVTGGVYAASKKAPFILVSSALTDSQKEIVKNTAPKTINVFGGTGAVSDDTVKAMIDTLVQPQQEQAPSEEVSEKE